MLPGVAHSDEEPEAVVLGTPTVDVGIPTLGTSPYLIEAVESVFAQTLPSWRLLISENGPGLDSVRRALEPYVRDPRVRHVVTGTRTGRGLSWTRASHGDAPYVGLLHDDDRWTPEFLERRVEFLETHPSCGFVYSGVVVIDETGRARGRSNPQLPPGVHPSVEFLPLLYRKLFFISVPTVLMRRSAYRAVGGQYKQLINLDTEIWLRLAACFDVGCLGVWDAEYRIHGAQTSSNRTSLAKEQLLLLDAVEDLPIRPALRRLVRAETHVRCALDAIERGEQRESVEHLGRAVRTDVSSVVRPSVASRMLAATAALATGARGRRTLANARARRWHSGGAEGLLDVSEDRPIPRTNVRVGASETHTGTTFE